MKRLLKGIVFAGMALVLVALPVLAAFTATISVTETSSNSYDMIGATLAHDVDYLADNGYIDTTGRDVRITQERKFMLSDDRIIFALPVVADATRGALLSTGQALQDYQIVPGYGGYITITDAAALELGNIFKFAFTDTWINTDTGTEKYLLWKDRACKLYIDEDGEVVCSIKGNSFTKLADPASPPTNDGQGVAFSADNTYLAIAWGGAPYLHIYKKSGDTFTKLDDPGTTPTGIGQNVAFSSDGTYLAVAHNTSPYITIYKRSGDTFTKMDNPGDLPTGNGWGVDFSDDDTYLAIGHQTSPYVTIYKRSGDTFTKLDNPGTLPPNNGRGIDFSSNGTYLAVGHETSPYITIYKRSGDTFTKLADPAVQPTGLANGVDFGDEGGYLAVSHDTSPFVTVYNRDGDTFTKIDDPVTLPGGDGYSVAFSIDELYMAVAHEYALVSRSLTVYKSDISYVNATGVASGEHTVEVGLELR